MSDEFEQWHRDDVGFAERVHEPLYNRLPVDRLPSRLARPTNERELVRAIGEARAAGQRIALRSGGTSWIGAGVREGGMLVDMGAFDQLRIDVPSRRAWVGPAVRSRDLVRELARHDLAFPVGHCGAPAMGGYLLGGGLGFNWGTWQPACFSVTGLRAVTADGRCLSAHSEHNSELLWMARGAGPGFPAVVTEFELALRERPRDTRLSVWHFPLDAADEAMRWLTRASTEIGPDVEIAVTTIGPDRTVLPPGPGVPNHLLQVAAIAYVDNEREARAALLPLEEAGAPEALLYEALMAVPFEELDLGAESAHPPGYRVLGDTFWTDCHVHEVMNTLAPLIQRAPSGKNSMVALMPAHGEAKAGVPRGPGAYSMDYRTLVMVFATWSDPADDAANRDWMNEVVPVLESISAGHYLSETNLLRDTDRAQRCFGTEEWKKLEELRRAWDPDGVFHSFPEPT